MAARYKCNLCTRYDEGLQHGMPGTSKRGISDHLSAVHGIAAPDPAYWTEFQAKWPAKVRKAHKARKVRFCAKCGRQLDDAGPYCFECAFEIGKELARAVEGDGTREEIRAAYEAIVKK